MSNLRVPVGTRTAPTSSILTTSAKNLRERTLLDNHLRSLAFRHPCGILSALCENVTARCQVFTSPLVPTMHLLTINENMGTRNDDDDKLTPSNDYNSMSSLTKPES